MAKCTADENSERKRISIPKADESVLAWWDSQKDPGLSVRLLVRNEIERNGYTDTAYRPVAQLPRRGRPPGTGSDAVEEVGSDVSNASRSPEPAVALVSAGVSRPVAQHGVAQPQSAPDGGFSAIDDLMNG